MWARRSGSSLQVAYEMADFAKYPTEIYTRLIRFLVTWVIPFAFVAYIPASFFLKETVSAAVIGIECVIAIVFWIIAYALFNKGTHIYESAGN